VSARGFADGSAFRVSLEARLRQTARATGIPLDRLRKEVAHQRLLARLESSAPRGSWALKGGQALLARLGNRARATKDTDATWRESAGAFAGILDDVALCLPLPEAGELRRICRETFELRRTPWPPEVPYPPDAWEREWETLAEDHDSRWGDLTAAFGALRDFLHPLVGEATAEDASWDGERWQWI